MYELTFLVSGVIAGFTLCYCAMVNPMKRQQVRLNGILDMMEESVRMRLIHKLGDGVDIGSR